MYKSNHTRDHAVPHIKPKKWIQCTASIYSDMGQTSELQMSADNMIFVILYVVINSGVQFSEI